MLYAGRRRDELNKSRGGEKKTQRVYTTRDPPEYVYTAAANYKKKKKRKKRITPFRESFEILRYIEFAGRVFDSRN